MDTLPTNFQKHTTSDHSRKFFVKRFNNTLIKTLKKLKVESILDAGCGEGFILNRLMQENVGKNLEGIDYSKQAVGIGKKQFPFLNIKVGDIYNLSYPDNSFDAVICSEVLEHLKDPAAAIREIRRVSKKYAVISVPNEPFFMGGRMLRGLNIKQFGNHPEHINHWTIFSFPRFIEKKRFSVKKRLLPFPWILVVARKR